MLNDPHTLFFQHSIQCKAWIWARLRIGWIGLVGGLLTDVGQLWPMQEFNLWKPV